MHLSTNSPGPLKSIVFAFRFQGVIDSGLVGRKVFFIHYIRPASVEVSRGEKMFYAGTGPEWYITEYTLACEEKQTECVCDTL